MRVGLKVKTAFSQGRDKETGERRTYKEGTFVPEEHHQQWPASTLATRLENKYVTWEPIDDAKEEVEPTLAELDKAGLLLYAEERYGLKLDRRGSVETMRQQIEAAEERRKLLANQEAVLLARAPKAPAPARPSIFGSRTPSTPAAPVQPIAPSTPADPIGDLVGTSEQTEENDDSETSAGGTEPTAT